LLLPDGTKESVSFHSSSKFTCSITPPREKHKPPLGIGATGRKGRTLNVYMAAGPSGERAMEKRSCSHREVVARIGRWPRIKNRNAYLLAFGNFKGREHH